MNRMLILFTLTLTFFSTQTRSAREQFLRQGPASLQVRREPEVEQQQEGQGEVSQL